MSNPVPAPTIVQFLGKARAALAGAAAVCAVTGNEAADLDSMASAVVYAWLRSREAGSSVCVPLIPIPREDFRLRTEAVYLFKEAGVSEQDLLFLEDVDLAALKARSALQLVLVDHNKPSKAMAAYADCVTGVIDHHQDEGLFAAASPRLVEPVGSCMTLVAGLALASAPAAIDRSLAVLMTGTVLLDTVNLDPQAGRVTPKDAALVAAVLGHTVMEQKALFDRLQTEKFNVADLSTADLLRKDYKEYVAGSLRYGMSSVLLSIADWKKKDKGLAKALAAYASERKLQVLVVMNAYTEPRFTRELVVYSADAGLFSKLSAWLAASDLGLAAVPGPADAPASAYGWYAQANESYSRKKLQPPLQDALAGF